METILALEIFDLTCPSNRMELHETMAEIEYYNTPYIRENHYRENYVIIVYEIEM